ncbi:hypothetical protein YP76_07015 [Sphingobium chungbukense]|uniref:Uncharacterized protein n=1 Tax=Sphingobium chungbukense TaxID=56193 RepID=A0A0M3AR38_9SPHN|nr:hypothetical protein YP76_07015 [Sphingobium chungbukense]
MDRIIAEFMSVRKTVAVIVEPAPFESRALRRVQLESMATDRCAAAALDRAIGGFDRDFGLLAHLTGRRRRVVIHAGLAERYGLFALALRTGRGVFVAHVRILP